tara:strand:+ start:198 stop:557 length:360 start_codon:yes stop_codon:yes gene_type:complete
MDDIDTTISDTNRAILSCNHEFHPKCILEWFKKSDSCPTCRELHMKKELSETADSSSSSRESIISFMNTIDEHVLGTQMDFINMTPTSLRTSSLISSRIGLSDITNSIANTRVNAFFGT